jgi:hypothetical protein
LPFGGIVADAHVYCTYNNMRMQNLVRVHAMPFRIL